MFQYRILEHKRQSYSSFQPWQDGDSQFEGSGWVKSPRWEKTDRSDCVFQWPQRYTAKQPETTRVRHLAICSLSHTRSTNAMDPEFQRMIMEQQGRGGGMQTGDSSMPDKYVHLTMS
jgi:hypothetical protein